MFVPCDLFVFAENYVVSFVVLSHRVVLLG
jgi:hypothetical protein